MRHLVRSTTRCAIACVAALAATIGLTAFAPSLAGAASGDPLAATSQQWRDARAAATASVMQAIATQARADSLSMAAYQGPATVGAIPWTAAEAARSLAVAGDAQAQAAWRAEAAARDAVIVGIGERTGASVDELRAEWAAAPARALDVLAAGLSALGTPYRYGGSGPGSYDCSGFVAAAYAAVGIELPHQSGQQWALATRVLVAGPADVLVHPSLGHIGLAVGAGLMVHAPQTGDVVKLAPVSPGDWPGRLLPG
jgi:cell wall-associated NlpC family hydrolase